jgi:glycerol-3-phosphate acyltransferase PlsX
MNTDATRSLTRRKGVFKAGRVIDGGAFCFYRISPFVFPMRIVVDAAGGEKLAAPIEAAVAAVKKYPELSVTIVGTEAQATVVDWHVRRLRKDQYDRIGAIFTEKAVPQEMREGDAIRMARDPKTTMFRSIQEIAEGRGEALVTSGNTAGLMFLAATQLDRFADTKPALMAEMPTFNGHRLAFTDAGANVDSTPEDLVTNFHWGAFAARALRNVEHPRGAFLNIAEEYGRGSKVIKEAQRFLQASEHAELLAGAGNAEPKHIFAGKVPSPTDTSGSMPFDFTASTGFGGNLFFKAASSGARAQGTVLKEEIMNMHWLNPMRYVAMAAGKIIKPIVDRAAAKFRGSVGGGMLMGVDATIVKVHGEVDAEQALGGIERAITLVQSEFLVKLRGFHKSN